MHPAYVGTPVSTSLVASVPDGSPGVTKDAQMTLRLPVDLHQELRRRAKTKGVNTSVLVRQLLQYAMDTPVWAVSKTVAGEALTEPWSGRVPA